VPKISVDITDNDIIIEKKVLRVLDGERECEWLVSEIRSVRVFVCDRDRGREIE